MTLMIVNLKLSKRKKMNYRPDVNDRYITAQFECISYLYKYHQMEQCCIRRRHVVKHHWLEYLEKK